MKIEVYKKVKLDIKSMRVCLPVMYEDEQIPYDFPLRDGIYWRADINVETGQVASWPIGKSGLLELKVVDGGNYDLIDSSGEVVGDITQNYAPNDAIPGEYGDYVKLDINESGLITNWLSAPDFSAFFDAEDN